MRSAIVATVLVAGLAASGPAMPTRIFPYPMTVERLDNGLRVVLVPYDSPGLVAYYSLVRVGSRHEIEPGHSGFAHLFEHLMFRGTRNHPREKWERLLKARGVSSSAFTWNDQTVYTFVAPTRALPTIVALEADRFQNLSYTRPVFQTETKAVLGEYFKNRSNPQQKIEEVLLGLAFEKHPYQHTTMGLLPDIKRMPERFDYAQAFFRRYYRPDNCVIFVVGDFDARRILALIKKHYGSWLGKGERPKIPQEKAQRRERRQTISWSRFTRPRLTIGFRTPSLGTDLTAAAIQNVLGPYLFGSGSPLHRELVQKERTAVSIRSHYVDTTDPRLFYFTVTLERAADLKKVEDRVLNEIAALRKGKVDGLRLTQAKSNLRYGTLMYMETPGRIAEALALTATPTGDPQTINRLHAAIAAVSARSVGAFAKKYLRKTNRLVVTLVGGQAAGARKGGK